MKSTSVRIKNRTFTIIDNGIIPNGLNANRFLIKNQRFAIRFNILSEMTIKDIKKSLKQYLGYLTDDDFDRILTKLINLIQTTKPDQVGTWAGVQGYQEIFFPILRIKSDINTDVATVFLNDQCLFKRWNGSTWEDL